MIEVAVILGARPEAIKMAPVILALRARPNDFRCHVCATGQHRDLTAPMLAAFGLSADVDFEAMTPNQSPAGLVSRVLASLDPWLDEHRPDLILAQGDTASALAAGLAGFWRRIPVGHVEAGLRTRDRCQPFPEEIQRRLLGVIADIHFAPTETARNNLLAENVLEERIVVTGNTVVDAVRRLSEQDLPAPHALSNIEGRLVVVTAHRRESLGAPMVRIAAAIAKLADQYPDVTFVVPVHPNPNVKNTLEPALAGRPNVRLTEPLDYPTFIGLARRAELLISDSGGIQEEAPSLGRRVVILRDVTERPEVLASGHGVLAGTDTDRIVATASDWLTNPAAAGGARATTNPFGDGFAAERIASWLAANEAVWRQKDA